MDGFDEALKAEEAAGAFIETWTKRWLLESYGVVTWADLNINNIQVTSLLTLHGVCLLIKTVQLHRHMLAMHMHTNLKVQSRRHIYSEVVCLQH